ncbi:hypothetical protein H1235_01900 [Pseudoxanthomonas sp. NC8]|nr:hypothetical protein H1235_01900 [Pseudoxanthomonas sp. NC8]
MKALRDEDVLSVSGGDAETKSWGRQLGALISEIEHHPEAGLLPPVPALIYLATRH